MTSPDPDRPRPSPEPESPGEVLDAVVAAALRQLGALDDRNLPMLAAHWVAQGRDGEVLVELAGLHGAEREIADLWPAVLAEVGIAVPVPRDRLVALPWVAGQVAAGQRPLGWLVTVLWPPLYVPAEPDAAAPDAEEQLLDEIVYTLDDILDFAERVAGDAAQRTPWWRYHGREEATRVQNALRQGEQAVAALARNDLAAAKAALTGR
ncbi:hypothetical protein [Blastococcus mobilis]|uniref:Uncharacterized protein n=1 Tax=Blastococcus mobilis TaxID=1938746 RepID=A0A239AH70_9ACTN|nr:hypothetical protein [Blastococcus mobilis]SNR95016.1 hypothetical protein SAMN06272737_14511 [Blastococcus mobilis]